MSITNKQPMERHVDKVFDSDEHTSTRAGTLLVSTHDDKSALSAHDIERVFTDRRAGIKMTKVGTTVLIPQPSDYANEALNWSWARKHKVLAVLVYCTLVCVTLQLRLIDKIANDCAPDGKFIECVRHPFSACSIADLAYKPHER
jgi:hypothetical protein